MAPVTFDRASFAAQLTTRRLGRHLVVRAETGRTSYTLEISDNTPGTAYTFGVASQDCTPTQSTIRTLNVTPSP